MLEITDAVNKRTDMDVSLWQGIFGGPVGTLVWSARIDNLTVLEAATDTLAGDGAYSSLLSKAGDWVRTPGEDSLLRMIHTAGGEYARPDVGAYAEATIVVPSEGNLAKATAFGVRIPDLHSKLTHASVLFCNSEYGSFGEMRWLAVYDNAAAVDNAARSSRRMTLMARWSTTPVTCSSRAWPGERSDVASPDLAEPLTCGGGLRGGGMIHYVVVVWAEPAVTARSTTLVDVVMATRGSDLEPHRQHDDRPDVAPSSVVDGPVPPPQGPSCPRATPGTGSPAPRLAWPASSSGRSVCCTCGWTRTCAPAMASAPTTAPSSSCCSRMASRT